MVQLPAVVHPLVYSPRHNVSVTFPRVTGLPSPNAERKINQAIQATLQKIMKDQGIYRPDLVEMNGWFEIKTNERGVLSLSLFNYQYSGGAHGLTVQKSLTFDVSTGRPVSLRQLFKPNAPYVQRLSAIVKRQIEARKLPVLEPFTQISPEQDFYIADKALVLYYPLYGLVPYAYGFPYFPISVYEIGDILDEAGPLGKMLS